MNRTQIVDELRALSGGGLITAKEVGMYVRDKNTTRVREKYLKGLESIRGKYSVIDVSRRLQKEFK